MPLLKGKSPESFKHNLKAEIAAGKPMKQSLAIAYNMKRKAKKMAMGGVMESGYMDHEGDVKRPDAAAIAEDNRDLNQHMVMVEDSGKYGEVNAERSKDESDESQMDRYAFGGDIVDHVMKKRKAYSEGGRVANGGDDELSKMADSDPNNFDDLALRDDLESSSNGANNGDFLGNSQEAEDRADIVARIMRSRAKKDRNPRPA